jgi:hypothetical protein
MDRPGGVKMIGASPVRLESFRWEKPGVATAVYVQLLDPGSAAPGRPSLQGLPSGLKLKYQGYSFRNVGSHVEFRWTYRGAGCMPRSPTDRSPAGDCAASEQWSMDISLMQSPITSHPDIDSIMNDFRGVLRAGEVEFPPYIDGKENPFYGVRDFFSPGVILKVQRVRPSNGISGSVSQLNGLGYIDAPTGSQFGFVVGSSGGARSPWLKVEYSFRAEGDQVVETEGWRYGGIGGRGGWLREIYRPKDSRF